jgi:hypothetical protein
MIEQPEGIVITISAGMLKEKGYKNWLTNFLLAMGEKPSENWIEGCTESLRKENQAKGLL